MPGAPRLVLPLFPPLESSTARESVALSLRVLGLSGLSRGLGTVAWPRSEGVSVGFGGCRTGRLGVLDASAATARVRGEELMGFHSLEAGRRGRE